jgi:hypothetical protein
MVCVLGDGGAVASEFVEQIDGAVALVVVRCALWGGGQIGNVGAVRFNA